MLANVSVCNTDAKNFEPEAGAMSRLHFVFVLIFVLCFANEENSSDAATQAGSKTCVAHPIREETFQ
jgi:hypothetical protein